MRENMWSRKCAACSIWLKSMICTDGVSDMAPQAKSIKAMAIGDGKWRKLKKGAEVDIPQKTQSSDLAEKQEVRFRKGLLDLGSSRVKIKDAVSPSGRPRFLRKLFSEYRKCDIK